MNEIASPLSRVTEHISSFERGFTVVALVLQTHDENAEEIQHLLFARTQTKAHRGTIRLCSVPSLGSVTVGFVRLSQRMRKKNRLERQAVWDQSADLVRCNCCYVLCQRLIRQSCVCARGHTRVISWQFFFPLQSMEFIVDKSVCFSSCVTICHYFMATNHHYTLPPWPGATVFDPRMFTTPAGDNDERSAGRSFCYVVSDQKKDRWSPIDTSRAPKRRLKQGNCRKR